MATWFDESRLDDEAALAAADVRLRELAESGARVRREADGGRARRRGGRRRRRATRPGRGRSSPPGPDSRLLRAVLEPWCPVPFVAWPGPALPGWAGGLDLVVVLAPTASDRGTAGGGRRGRTPRLPGRGRLPAGLAGGPSTPRAGGRRSCRP